MTWPETTISSRVLAGAVAAVLGAILGFVVANIPLSSDAPVSSVVYFVVGGAVLAFLAAFWKGDAAVRVVARTFRWL